MVAFLSGGDTRDSRSQAGAAASTTLNLDPHPCLVAAVGREERQAGPFRR